MIDWLHGDWPNGDAVRLYLDDRAEAWALVDADDYPALARSRWRLHTGGHSRGRTVYARCSRTDVYLHAMIMPSSTRPTPRHRIIDHRNGDGLDCRRSNLEWVTVRENLRRWIYRDQLWMPGVA